MSDIERAGFDDEVEVLGGGTFGIVEKSNWVVCEQLPAAGEAVTDAPRVSFDRSCPSDATEPPAPTTEPAPASSSQPTEPSAPATAESVPPSVAETVPPAAEPTLTVENSEDLKALLAGPDCTATVAAFASTYQGRTIEFDGNIANLSPHGDTSTRYDILVLGGDFSETSAAGPNFQFADVGIFDLQLTGPNIPDSLNAGDNIHVIATVGAFDQDSCRFALKPVSTALR